MTDKPLHVAVAEALGWEPWTPPTSKSLWGDIPELLAKVGFTHIRPGAGLGVIPRYDTDWAATGPLIERFGLTVAPHDLQPWVAFDGPGINAAGFTTYARTPLLAVCHLILALKEAGKL